MSFEITQKSNIIIISSSLDKFFKIVSLIIAIGSLFVSIGSLTSSDIPFSASLFSLITGLIPFTFFYLGRKTLVIDIIKKEVIIFYELYGFNIRAFKRSTHYSESTIVKMKKIRRYGTHGRLIITNQIYLEETSYSSDGFILFEIVDDKEARNFLLRISKYLGVKSEDLANENEVEGQHINPKLILLPPVIFLIFIIIALIGTPKALENKIPKGAQTYLKGEYICWDKTVCCNPRDRSTCVTIPTCVKR